MDIGAVIMAAKLGRERKDAQLDTCAVFAAALFDVLTAHGIPCTLFTAVPKNIGHCWAHSVVEVAGHYYDSMGEFSTSIYRVRAKIHPTVTMAIDYQPDSRDGCYEPEFDALHAFHVHALSKALRRPTVAA